MKNGQRLRSQVCSGEVIVIRATGTDGPIHAGGRPMVSPSEVPPADTPAEPHQSFLLGKRYELSGEDDLRVEVMVTRAGSTVMTYDGRALTASQAKALPSSD